VQFIHPSIMRMAAVIFASTLLLVSAEETPRPAFPAGIRLATSEKGEAAINALGNKLPEVAAHYRKTPEDLRALLRSDKCLHANTDGRLFYSCDLHKHAPAAAEEAPAAAIGPTDPAPFPTAEAFLLHTRPGANRVIYLDFDGHIDNTPGNWKDGASAPPFDTNGDSAVFSTSERERIIYIWQRVAEDFAMFNIDVTTEDPGVEALRKTNSSDQIYGIRCVIGGSSGGTGDWYTSSAGGVAFVGSFDATGDVPCWVFPGNLGNSEKNIAEAASHEVGHTLGLSHDGTSSVDYYNGHGNWAPIMGVGYSKDIVQWSKGEYAGANNLQDDLAVMLTQGAVYRTDDHGGTTATATFLTADVLPVLGEGVIEKRTDLDFFRVAAAGGSLSINVKLAPRSSNLRLEVKLYDSAGTVLQTATIADSASTGTLPVTLTRTVTAGNYYFSVDGIGSGDPLSTGYSDYASLGQYLLSVSGVLPGGTTWQPTAAGTYQWNTLANWSASPVINAAGATIRVTNNIAGNQTINLTTPVTIGNLYLGDSNSTHGFTLASSGGSLTFDNSGSPANLSNTTGTHDIISATLVFTSNLIVTQSAAGNLSLTGPVTGAGSLTKTGAGNLILSGAKNYTGPTTVNDGVLRIDTSDALPSGNIIIDGGGIIGLASTFSGRTDGTGANQVQWTGDGGFAAFGADRSVNLSTMSWGSTTLSGNILILGHSTADATLLWASNLSFAGGSRTIQVNDGSDAIDAKISSVLSGGGTFNKTGGGTLELTGNNSYTAITNLTDGLLLLSSASALPASNLILAGGTLGLGNGNLTARTLGAGDSQVRWSAESGFAAFGATRAVKFSTISLNWTDTNFIGTGRNLILGHPTANATLDWQQAISFAGSPRTIEVLNGSAAIDAQMSGVIAGGSSGTSNALNKTGEGTLALTSQNTYFGDTNITAGTLMIGIGGSTGGLSQNSPAINVTSGAALAVNRCDTVTQGGNALKVAISGEGDFFQVGTGTTTLNLANTYTGDTIISAGTLALGASNVLANTTPIIIGNATLNAATFTDTLDTLDLTAASTINLGAGAALAFANSSTNDWTGGTLTITGNFVSGASLRFGTTASGLTPAQLALISSPGFTTFALNSTGYLIATGYPAWKVIHAPTGTASDDYDNDGVPNAIEYILGGTATTRDAAKLPQVTTSGGKMILTFIRDQASIDGTTTLTIETGTNLAAWPSSYPVPTVAANSNPGVSVIKNLPAAGKDTITLTLPLSSSTAKFARLKVLP
jgi:autotransporter-associated beta strand protein